MSGEDLAPAEEAVVPGQIRVRGVSRRFRVQHERSLTLKETVLRRRRLVATEFEALRDIDLDVAPGEAVGIVGRNGSGKSTLLKILAGIFPPHEGTVEIGGTLASLLELGSGFHPDFTGRENVAMNGAIHGLDEHAIDDRIDEIVAFAELEEFIDNPVRTYSSGMMMRLGFAVAAHLRPDVLLLDEVLAVGDEAFQRKCIAHIFEFRRAGGTIVFVSHDPGAVERVCDRAVLVEHGDMVASGLPGEVLAEYRKLLVATGAGAASGDVHDEAPREGGAAEGRAAGDEAPDLVLNGYRLLGPSGVTDRVMSEDELAIEIDVTGLGGIGTVVARIGVVSDEGPLVLESGTSVSAPDGEMTTIRLDLPDSGLNTGGFSVTLTLSDELLQPLEIREHVLPFNVFPRGPGRAMLAATGEWTTPAGLAAPQAPPAQAPPAGARALREGFRVGGRDDMVLVVASADPARVRGGGLAVYDGRRLEVVDRLSTAGLAVAGDTLLRLLAPAAPDPPGPLELLAIDDDGLRRYRRISQPAEATGLACGPTGPVVHSGDRLVWIDDRGDVVRSEPGHRIEEGAAVERLLETDGTLAAIVRGADSVRRLLDVERGEVLVPDAGAAGSFARTADGGWIAADRRAGHLLAAAPGRELRMPIDGPAVLLAGDEVLIVGRGPAEPSALTSASIELLDPATLHPLASVELPFPGVDAIVACPRSIVAGLRALARDDLPGLLDGGRRPPSGWLVGTPAPRVEVDIAVDAPDRVLPDAHFTVSYLLRNRSQTELVSAPPDAVMVAYRWRDADGGVLDAVPAVRTRLPGRVAPGAALEGRARVVAPHAAGSYRLELALHREGAGWLTDDGEASEAAARVEVAGGGARVGGDYARRP